MKIGLLDVDNTGKFPNLALMKISAYHKAKGDQVSLISPLESYDKELIYASKVFSESDDLTKYIHNKKIIKGGVGFFDDPKNDIELPCEIEHIYPDYSLYDVKSAYGFLTRGCSRNCSFCNVTQHQGSKMRKVANLKEFWTDQKEIVLLDPNLLGCKEKYDLLQQLIDSKACVDFTQGLDARLIDDKSIDLINQIKVKMLHFAWDSYEFDTYEKLKLMRNKFKHSMRKMTVYVLTNYDTSHEENLERIYKLKELDYWPYVMVYNKHEFVDQNGNLHKYIDEIKTQEEIKRFKLAQQVQRWVNNRFIFRSAKTFDDYKKL